MQELRHCSPRKSISMQTIDIHAHFFPESWPDFAARFGSPDWPWMKPLGDGEAMIMLGNREFRRITQVCWDPTLRLEDLDRQGVDLQVISATPVLFSYNRPAEQALEVARIFNDAALEMCGRASGRLKALCQVPLQDIDASCAEVSRCMQRRAHWRTDRKPCRPEEPRRSRHRYVPASLC